RVAGFIHLGGTTAAIEDRPRPPLAEIVTNFPEGGLKPMFYATAERDRTKLPHDPFKAIVAPRPVGWVSTRALDGRINLAPYSFSNGLSSGPPIVGFSSEGWKDSVAFAKESGEFVANLATHDLRGPMNQTSGPFPRGDNEFVRAGLTMAECRLV